MVIVGLWCRAGTWGSGATPARASSSVAQLSSAALCCGEAFGRHLASTGVGTNAPHNISHSLCCVPHVTN